MYLKLFIMEKIIKFKEDMGKGVFFFKVIYAMNKK
jgi:hypothetical protein